MSKKTLFVVAGGSGGHILPAIQLAKQWLTNNPDGHIVFFTGSSELEKKIFKNHPHITKIVPFSLPKFSRAQWWKIPWLLTRLAYIFCTTVAYTLRYWPERVIGTGGLLAVPVCIASRGLRRRVEIYNLDVLPGKAVKALFSIAHTIFIIFPQTQLLCRWHKRNFFGKCQQTNYPLRFNDPDRNIDLAAVKNRINTALQQQNSQHPFDTTRKTIFVLGGSQGSVLLNNLIKQFVQQHQSLPIQIIHQTGAFEEQQWSEWYAANKMPAFTFNYDERVHEYYALADVIVCRAGAGTLFEIAFFQKPCIVIPLIAPTTSHQIYNARAMVEQHPSLFTILEQEHVHANPTSFMTTLRTKLAL